MPKIPMRKVIFIAFFAGFGMSQADTVYKSVGPDGRTVYSQDPPAGKAAKTLTFSNLPSTPMPESALRYRDELEKSMKKRLAEGARPRDFVLPTLFTAQWCGYCRQAKAYLAEKKVRYQEYDIDTADGMRAYVESGSGRGVPVLVWKGQKLQGFSRGAYDALVGGSR
ncbi:MAG TPA: glutaredoxin family protein [Burkholderiales bacterium]|nr:glutaredoxin family protein [Burkholderiales bacterium]